MTVVVFQMNVTEISLKNFGIDVMKTMEVVLLEVFTLTYASPRYN